MRTSIIKYFVLIHLLGSSLFAQEPECVFPDATKIKPIVQCEVALTQSGFNYSYTVRSSSESIQDIWGFMVDYLSADVEGMAPEGWRGKTVVNTTTFSWGARFMEVFIKPNQSLNDFVIKSKGLPTITTYYVEGYVKLPVFPEGGAPDECIGDNPFENSVKGKILGPVAPPADLKPLEFLDYIISQKHEAYNLGWITNKGIEQSLDTKLENAKLKIKQGNIIAAKNILTAFLNEVKAQGCKSYDNCPKGKHLTPEAYALLFYNVNYLIEQLK